jgi:hypothetical protein
VGEVAQVLFGTSAFRVLDALVDPLDGELGVLVETVYPDHGWRNGARPKALGAGGSTWLCRSR